MKILHVDSSILGSNSVSRKLSAGVMARLRAAHPEAEVIYRDLGQSPVPHLSGFTLMAAQNPGGEHAQSVQADLALGGAVLQEFLGADTVVIGLALYNFAISSQLKAWIDRIVIVGQTFRYGPEGRPEGLAGGKRVIVTVARGGFYGPGAPAAPYEHGESYLRAVFGFLGIGDIEVVVAEGLAVGTEQRAAAISGAEAQIKALAA